MADQLINPFPLPIGNKEDSWDKLRQLEHIDPSLKLPAEEVNVIKKALDYLYRVTGGASPILGNVPARYKNVFVDHNVPGDLRIKMVNAMNAMSNYELGIGNFHFVYTDRIVLNSRGGVRLVDDTVYGLIREVFVITKKVEPNSQGLVSIGVGGTVLNYVDIQYITTVDTRDYAPTDYDLGDIGLLDIWDAVNAGGPFGTPNGASVIFRAVQDGDAKLWLYRGSQEEIGTGYEATFEADYRLFPDVDAVDPAPTFLETLPFYSERSIDASVVKLNNHEGILWFSRVADKDHNNFNTAERKVGGKVIILIDTEGREEFPTVDGGAARLLNGDEFEEDSNFVLKIGYDGVTVNYEFQKIGQVVKSPGGAIATSEIMLMPNIMTPNSDMKVVIQAKNINTQTIASFGGSVNLTSQLVKLNRFGGLVIECFISVGATEETVSVTLNNGLETVYNNVFSVVNGTVFIPNADDWNSLSALAPIFTLGAMSPSSDLGSSGTIKQDVLAGTNFLFEFIVHLNPLFSPYTDSGYKLDYDWLSMMNSFGERKQHAYFRNKGTGAYPQCVWRAYLALFPAWSYNMTFGQVNTISRIDGTWFFYNNNVLIKSFPETNDFDFTFKLLARQFTYSGIKYVNLSDIEAPKEYNDNFLAVGDLTSNLVNNGENGKGSYAETAIVTADTGQIISLNNAVGNYCNMGAVSVQNTFTIGDRVIGGVAMVLIDISGMTNYPVVTGSNFIETIGDFSVVTASVLEMVVWYDGTNVNHYFLTR